jgi:hypothetical protein
VLDTCVCGVKARTVDERKKDETSSVKDLSLVDEQTTTHVILPLLFSIHTPHHLRQLVGHPNRTKSHKKKIPTTHWFEIHIIAHWLTGSNNM